MSVSSRRPVPPRASVSLAHNGVLFLDEFRNSRRTPGGLRQPLEDGKVTITRSATSATFPARLMLAAAITRALADTCPIPAGVPVQPDADTPVPFQDFRAPARQDRHPYRILPCVQRPRREKTRESSSSIRDRVNLARAIQKERFSGAGISCNAHMSGRQIKQFCSLCPESKKLMEMAVDQLGLSARGFTRIIKAARTIADLEGCDQIRHHHISEAIHYRSLMSSGMQ